MEEDGRWLAEVLALPGMLAYGVSKEEAMAKAEALALRVIAERLEHGMLARVAKHTGLIQTTFEDKRNATRISRHDES